ncbi:MAG: restriction endonuclease [Candidatus Sumerlaeota bacterium]|nr:restriction endonuclease [Candidatus Sumerlaeota bacterium]
MIKAPWDRSRLRVTPRQFERMVVEFLRTIGCPLKEFIVQHQTAVRSPDGEFDMDAVATFEALGADFLVLVECKNHTNPIKRELVQVLADKLSSTHAHKGMLFSSAPFQKGAIKFAVSRRIALVHFTEGGPIFEARAQNGPVGPNRPYDAYSVTLSEVGEMVYSAGSGEAAKMLFGYAG